jgi:hypothetical protein
MSLQPRPVEIPSAALAALARLQQDIGAHLPDGASFGIGAKRVGDEYLDEIALIVFVPEKLPPERVPEGAMVPASVAEKNTEFRTDVMESRPVPIAIVNDNAPYSPLRGGIEIGWREHVGVGAVSDHYGTLGCVVQRRSDGVRQFLTAGHVAPLGTGMTQPGPADPPTPAPQPIGTSVTADPPPSWDCAAIDWNLTRGTPSCTVHEIGEVNGAAAFQLWSGVTKRGRTTGLTTGFIVAIGIPDPAHPAITALYIDTFPFGGLFCWEGDSGSAILDTNNNVVGLLIEKDDYEVDNAGEPLRAKGLASPIQSVLDALQVEIAVSPPVVTSVAPNTAVGVLANAGWTQIGGQGFDASSQVSFGGVPALTITPASPHRLIVTPPVQFLPGVAVDVIVTNAFGENSLPNATAKFTY